ncbi:MAG: fumarylacetoacetase [Acidimicrobiales bacterium]
MSWLSGSSDFPKDHLPYGIFQLAPNDHRMCVPVGDLIVDLAACVDAGLLTSIGPQIARAGTLNPLIDLGPPTWQTLRDELLLLVAADEEPAPGLTHALNSAQLLVPVHVPDYVDFYSSIEHATNLGRLFRPDSEPLLPNWRHIPIAYHGRSGTIVASGTPITRPVGQTRPPGDESPTFGPSKRLDIELELGAILYRSPPGAPVTVDQAEQHIFGLVLVNDWSARDIQAWEYQPLGPFLGKSFATTVGPWVVPFSSASRFRVDAPAQSPAPLEYLDSSDRQNFDIHLNVALQPDGAEQATVITTTTSALLYWTFAQQIAHMTSNGAHLSSGDLIASGTISGSEPEAVGSLIERTENAQRPMTIAGQSRTFLADHDTVIIDGRLGGSTGPSMGQCIGTVRPSDRSNS